MRKPASMAVTGIVTVGWVGLAACGSTSTSGSTPGERPDHDRRLRLADRRLLRGRQGACAGLRPLGAGRERQRWPARPPRDDEVRRRRQQHDAGRHQLPEPDHAGQGRARVRAVQQPADDPRVNRDRPLWVRLPRARGRWPERLQPHACDPLAVLRPAGTGRGQPGEFHAVGALAPGVRATGDCRVLHRRRSVHPAADRQGALAARSRRDHRPPTTRCTRRRRPTSRRSHSR